MANSKIHIKKGRLRVKLVISCLVALVCCCGLAYSGYQLILWFQDSNETKEITEEIFENVAVAEQDDDDNTQTAGDNNKNSLYWQYINTNLIDVDFSQLREMNSDVAGWIQLKGTNINYPFVHTSNNDFYLDHSIEKKYSRAGWVFADFRNHVDGTDRNLILYAHGRYDSTMFGTLRNILSSGWLNNSENFTVRTSTDKVNALWQVFSVYRVPTTNDYIQTDFRNDAEYQTMLDTIKNRSSHNFNTNVSASDRILTLSTCYSSTERVVLHAKLIKWQNK